MTEAAHSTLGPSSGKRWLNCPGSVLATKDLPDRDTSYSLEGTAAHTVAQLAREKVLPAAHFLDMDINVKKVDGLFTTVRCDQEMVDGVQQFIDHLNDLPGTEFNESRVHYYEWVPEEGFGTMDAAKATDTVVYLRDFKYGKGVQEFAKRNVQLMLYALGFYEDFGWMYPSLEKFNIGIVQPRLGHIDEWEISLAELLAWADAVVRPGAIETKNPNAAFKAGDWCQFCKIKSTCVVRAQSIMDSAIGDFENLDAAVTQATIVGPTRVVNMTPEQIDRALGAVENIRKWCGDIETHAMREIQQGRRIGEWKLVEGRSNRAWGLPEEQVVAEARKAGLDDPKKLYAPAELLSPSQAEKTLGKKHPLFKREGVITKPKGAPKLAPGSDERKAMNVGPQADFEPLGEDE